MPEIFYAMVVLALPEDTVKFGLNPLLRCGEMGERRHIPFPDRLGRHIIDHVSFSNRYYFNYNR